MPRANRPLQLLVTEPLGLKDGCDPKVWDCNDGTTIRRHREIEDMHVKVDSKQYV